MGLLLRSLWMSYKLRFHELALVEWKKIDGSIREIFKKNTKNGLKIRAFQVPRFLICQTVIK
jgi:hypothetical protein